VAVIKPFPLTSADYFVFTDTESSGLHSTDDQIIQLTCVLTGRYPAFPIITYFSSYVRLDDEREIHPEAFKTHGLSREFLADKPVEEMVALLLHDFTHLVPSPVFAGYNCPFDLAMLDALQRRTMHLAAYKTPSLDIYRELKARVYLGNHEKAHSLESALKHFGLSTAGAHDSATDIYNTIKLARIVLPMPIKEELCRAS